MGLAYFLCIIYTIHPKQAYTCCYANNKTSVLHQRVEVSHGGSDSVVCSKVGLQETGV